MSLFSKASHFAGQLLTGQANKLDIFAYHAQQRRTLGQRPRTQAMPDDALAPVTMYRITGCAPQGKTDGRSATGVANAVPHDEKLPLPAPHLATPGMNYRCAQRSRVAKKLGQPTYEKYRG